MLLRRVLFAALVVAPFLYSPSEASAQTGLDRAAVATARADDVGAAQNSHAPQDLPAGVARRFEGKTLPPGIRRTRSEAAAPSSGSDPGTGDTGTGGGDAQVCLAYQTVWSGLSSTQVCILWGTL